jgi:hypothetical protein
MPILPIKMAIRAGNGPTGADGWQAERLGLIVEIGRFGRVSLAPFPRRRVRLLETTKAVR